MQNRPKWELEVDTEAPAAESAAVAAAGEQKALLGGAVPMPPPL